MNRERLLLVVLLCVLAITCEWLACNLYSPSQNVPSTSQSATTTEVILNDSIPRPYPADNWWNLDISDAPVDSDSDVFIDWIGTTVSLHLDCGEWYGIPYCTVGSDQPFVDVDIYAYPAESDPREYYPGPFPYPVPTEATFDWRYVGNPPDSHCLMYNRDTRILYELFCAEWTGTEWRAKSGAIFKADGERQSPEARNEHWTSADASGMAILPGLVKYDEVMGEAPILHAHRFTVRATNGFVWPASHAAGTTSGAPPMGCRLRLRADFPIDNYPAPVRNWLISAQTCGLILTDNGSDMFITGTMDEDWEIAMWIAAFNTITASDFEVIELGWTPDEEPPPSRDYPPKPGME